VLTSLKCEGPARVEAAACWGRTDLERRLFKNDSLLPRVHLRGGNRGKQRARVRMVGLRNRSRRSATSTILPKYIRATRRVRCSTMARSWLADAQPRQGATLARRGDTPHGPLGISRRTSIRLAGHKRGHRARNLSAGVATRRRRSRHCGIQAARRKIDNERPNLAGATIFEPRRQQFDVRRRQGAGLRIGVAEGAMDKGHEVAPNKRGIFLGETGTKITIATTSEQELGLVSGCL
jgi:hypothetical protein